MGCGGEGGGRIGGGPPGKYRGIRALARQQKKGALGEEDDERPESTLSGPAER